MKAKGKLLEYHLNNGRVLLQLQYNYWQQFRYFWDKHKTTAVILFDFEKYYKKKSTGPHSLNNHVLGHARTIADEMGEDVRYIRDLACVKTEGFPITTNKFGDIRPKIKWADVNSKLASQVVETLHRMAAWLNIRLIENDWGEK